MKLQELLMNTKIIASEGDLQKEISGIEFDSRLVKPDSLFVAISGFKNDGHEYIADARKKGATAFVIQDSKYSSSDYTWALSANTRKALAEMSGAFYNYPSRRLNVIGVTGTNGKTTTTNLIAKILEDNNHPVGLIGTIHNRIGSRILPVSHTTPEAPELNRLFLDMEESKADYAVMEVSSHAIELDRISGIEYDVAVFTNLTQDHLDFHNNMDAYFTAKSKLFSSLGVNSTKNRRKYAIINGDDLYAERLADVIRVPVISYGIRGQVDVKAKDVKVTAEGVSYILKYTNQEMPVKLRMTGTFNVYNSLAAIAVGIIENVPIENIIATLEKVDGIPGRFEKVDAGQDFTVIVDYSHTPDSLEKCLKTAREITKGRLLTIFGCGGDRDRTKRPLMGEVAGRLSDFSIVTSDNPRTENPQEIIKEILIGLKKKAESGKYALIPERKEAIFWALEEARPGDVVVIAGKGHEDYQIIGTKKYPFDDRKVALEALSALFASKASGETRRV